MVSTPSHTSSGLLEHQRALVSPLCGIIKKCERIQKDYSEPLLPYIYRAELANSRFVDTDANKNLLIASGKGFTHASARTSALGEAVERYSGSCWQPEQIRYAKRHELPGLSLNPRDLVLYADNQYPHLRYAPYSEDTELGWVLGRTLGKAEPIWIPAIAVYLSYDVRNACEFICPITSNGLAAGQSLDFAVLKAVLEVIERDAFLACWMHRLPARRVDVATHPDAQVRELYEAYRRRGVEIELYALPTDHAIPVFMALSVDSRSPGPAVVVGLGAHPDAADAARSATMETAQVRPALRIRMRSDSARERMKALLADPQVVTELEDHDLLYASSTMLPAFDFLRNEAMMPFTWVRETADSSSALERVSASLERIGVDACYCDVTPADMALLDLHTARAIIPGFQPIHFGAQEARLGGSRLFDLPRVLGFRENRTSISALNPDPHPLS